MRFRIIFIVSCILAGPHLLSPAGAQERDLAGERALERKCLDCHNNPSLHGARATGELRSVFVDTERYRKSVHYEKECTCLSCHPEATSDHHPREGVRILPCGSCHDHEDELRDFQASRHGAALAARVPNAPDCFSCHSNHYTRKKDDPEARVHPGRVGETCGSCHADQVPSGAAGSWWAGGRLSGHGKRDLSETFTTQVCTRCHVGPDTHRTPGEDERSTCSACHTRETPAGDVSPLMGSVHLGTRDPFGLWLTVRTAGAWAAVAALVLLLIPVTVFGARWRRQSKAPAGAGEAGHGS